MHGYTIDADSYTLRRIINMFWLKYQSDMIV